MKRDNHPAKETAPNLALSSKNKILKKFRTAKDFEDKYDVGLELYVAFIFTTSDCEVVYEPNLHIQKRPDLEISFDDLCFFCEVKRIRYWIDEILEEEMYKKCGDIICEKAMQSVANEINIVYLRRSCGNFAPDYNDFQSGFENLFNWMENNPKEFLDKIKMYKMKSVQEFKTYWEQISAVIIPMAKDGKSIPVIWKNPNATKPLTKRLELKIYEAIQKPFRYDQ